MTYLPLPQPPQGLISVNSFRVPEYIVQSAWHEHAPFLFWLMGALRPRCYVELGCHTGYSYFAACQAVKQLDLGTACYAVDSWEGDEHAGFYGQEVFAAVSAQNQAHYAGFSRLIRARFDAALPYFGDRSIDLLHVDGRHLYEDVSTDFHTWRPKLTANAIVLFHDTNVRERGFGVWRLFEELRSELPAFEFLHGNGLGVVALGEVPAALEPLFAADEATVTQVRGMYAALGDGMTQRWLLQGARAEVGRLVQARQGEIDAARAELIPQIEAARAEAGTARADAEAARAEAEARRREAETLHAMIEQLQALAAEHHREAAAAAAALDRAKASHAAQLDALGRKVKALVEEQGHGKARLAEARAEADRLRSDYAAVTNSLSWRLTARAREAFARHPRAGRAALSLARVGWWGATLRFGRLRDGARSWLRTRRQAALVRQSGLFDEAFYRQAYPEVAAAGWNPLRHYLLCGGFEGRRPHPLFDSAWYLQSYPDVAMLRVNPLVHFLRNGLREGRNPNPYFDLDWYRRRHPDAAGPGVNPLLHYMRAGGPQRLDPSPRFKAGWYLGEYPDIAAAGLNPLVHFLLHGKAEGRRPTDVVPVDFTATEPVTRAAIECLKQPGPRPELALFVTHSPSGRLKSHVRGYLEALRREGIAPVLIVAADAPFTENEPWLQDLVEGLFVRENRGFDFAAWAHVLRLHPELYRGETIYWLNDSLIGPTNAGKFHAMIERVRQHPADLVGLTANHERGLHVQSYFLALKKGLLQSPALHRFVLDVGSFPDKEQVIDAYEIRFAPAMQLAGHSAGAVFKEYSIHNPTLYHWRELLEEGFPFIKVMALTNDLPIDKSGWREALAADGYDAALAERVLLERLETPPGRDAPPPVPRRAEPQPNRPARVAFIAPASFSNGLGVAARGYLGAFMHSGLAFNYHPIRRPFHIHQRVAPSFGQYEFVGPADVAVVHVNPDGWPHLLTPEHQEIIDTAARRVGIFVWESHTLPPAFVERLSHVDGVWAPSRYCAEGFRQVAETPVDIVPHPVPVRLPRLTPDEVAERKRGLGLEPTDRVILFGFDASSYLARKNPLALVKAFAATRLADSGWRLILKTKHLAEDSADAAQLRRWIEQTPGVSLIERMMSTDEMDALMEAADIYASPHSSEGFGLTVAEAMALGKLAVATDYGGTRDFLDAATGFPVRHGEYQLAQDDGLYLKGTTWARVNEGHLAECLAAAASLSAEERAAYGARARQRIVDLLSPEAVAREMNGSIGRLLVRPRADAARPAGG